MNTHSLIIEKGFRVSLPLLLLGVIEKEVGRINTSIMTMSGSHPPPPPSHPKIWKRNGKKKKEKKRENDLEENLFEGAFTNCALYKLWTTHLLSSTPPHHS